MPVTTRSFDIIFTNAMLVVVGWCEDEEERSEDDE